MTTDLSINKIKSGVKVSYFPGGSVSSGGQEKTKMASRSKVNYLFALIFL